MRRWQIGLLGAGVSLLAAVFIVSEIDLGLLGDALQRARFVYVIPCILLLLAGLVTRALRWRLLLSGGLPLDRAFHIMNVAYLVNGVLPLRIGEVARIYLAARVQPPVPVLKSTSTIIVERLLDLLSVVLLMAFALVVGPVPDELRATGAFFGMVGFFGFLFLVFLARQRSLAHRLLMWAMDMLPFLKRLKIDVWLDHFLDGLLPLTQMRTLLAALGWSAVSWGLSVAAGFVLMYTFYDEASLVATCLYIPAVAFAIAVPAVPGNLGTYELSILLALGAVGYGEPETVAVAFAVLVHATNVAVHAITGVVGFIQEGISLQQLMRETRATA